MNTQVTFNGVTIDLNMNEPPYELKGRGWVHFAKLIGGYANDSVKSALVGKSLWDKEIIGVEAYATVWLREGSPIGILTKEKMW
jgi:hypothetical protein